MLTVKSKYWLRFILLFFAYINVIRMAPVLHLKHPEFRKQPALDAFC